MDNTTIYEFLQEKSVTPTGPGSYSDSTEMSNALKVFKKNSSPKTKGKKDVNFYDYDGSLVDSYSAEEFLQLSAMPANPSHDGLTAQGWNWTLSDAKGYVSDYGKLNIGQMYITDDGKTRIHIKLEEGRLKPRLGLGINGSAVVDWGDNSQTDTMTGSDLTTTVYQEHEYFAPGEYIISIAVTGKIAFLGDLTDGPYFVSYYSQLLTEMSGNADTSKVYLNSIKSIELGNNIISIGDDAFCDCCSLTSVTIPDSVTSIGQSAFGGCCSLTSVIIPNNVTSIGEATFNDCCSLTSVTIPDSVTSVGQSAFGGCCSLTSVTIPNSVTSIDSAAFDNCTSLTSVIIPNNVTSIDSAAFRGCCSLTSVIIPNDVTSIGEDTFSDCQSLTSITIPGGVTSLSRNMLYNCYSLTSVIIPDSVTSIDSGAFYGCKSLTSITIPSGVTSIDSATFYCCYSLTSLTIPDSVRSIGQYAFDECFGLGFIKFKKSTPATVSNADAWGGIPTDCIIYVPQGSLSAYTSASNYPSSSTYTYVEY